MKNPYISIIIPVYNRLESLLKCLRAIFEEIQYGNHEDTEVIVIDDGSTEDLRICQDKFQVKYYKLDENKGTSIARNIGLKKAAGEIIFFIDSDVLLQRNALKYLKENFRKNNQVCAVQGNFTPIPFQQNFFSRYKNILLHNNFYIRNKKKSSGIATFCVGLKKDIIDRLKGFDENITFFCEDEDLGHKIYAAGYAITFDNRIQAQHLKKYNLYNLLKQDFNVGFSKTKLVLSQHTVNQNYIKGSHLSLRYLLSIPTAVLIILTFVLLVLYNKLLFKISLPALLIFYLLLNIEHYYYVSKYYGLIFTINSFLFSFINNLIFLSSIIAGAINFVIYRKK